MGELSGFADNAGGLKRDPSVFRIDASRAASRQVGDETVVLDLVGSVYYGLNGTGGALWNKLLSGATRAELMECLGVGTSTTAERIGLDVDAFLSELGQQGLLGVPDE